MSTFTAKAAACTAAAVAMAAGMAVGFSAGPAAAAEPPSNLYEDTGCKFRVYEPTAEQVEKGSDDSKRITAVVKVRCAVNSTVRLQTRLWELDRGKYGDVGGSDNVGRLGDSAPFRATEQTRTFTYSRVVNHSYDVDRRGEFFQRVRIQVHLDGASQAEDWTPWEHSPFKVVRIV
ncbi:MAG TPA: hypothetical protein VEQ66_13300 [Propionibacteriaceae bacterium]|nr:hypothetical protein [Propionibacteriaceae bacterium]